MAFYTYSLEEIEKYEYPESSFDGPNRDKWSHNRIYYSLADGRRFCTIYHWYEFWLFHWLSLPLNEPCWLSSQEKLDNFISSLTDRERKYWDDYHLSHEKYELLQRELLRNLSDDYLEQVSRIYGRSN